MDLPQPDGPQMTSVLPNLFIMFNHSWRGDLIYLIKQRWKELNDEKATNREKEKREEETK